MKRNLVTTTVAIVLAVFALMRNVSAQTIPNYALIDLGTLDGGSYSYALGINASGEVVGYADDSSGSYQAFLYSNGTIQGIGTLGGDAGRAYGINDSGQIVGYSFTTDDNAWHAFKYANSVMNDLGTLSSSNIYASSYAYCINNAGQVGGYSDATNFQDHAFLFGNDNMQDVHPFSSSFSKTYGINAAGQMVGIYLMNNGRYHSFLSANNTLTDIGTLPGGDSCYAYAINNSGQVVGYADTNGNVNIGHAFLYSTVGGMQDLGSLGGSQCLAYGINNNGQVVGSANPTGSFGFHAFLYSDGLMQDLNSLIVPTNSGWTLEQANAINDAGQIVGYGIDPDGDTHAFLLNPLPPGSVLECTNNQPLPTYGAIPPPEDGQDSIIVITHGWIDPGFPSYETAQQAMDSVNSMSNSIEQYLTANNISNWRVYGYAWTDQATATLLQGGPATALNNAFQQGKIVGDSIVADGWSHIHFIAHSAGAGLIQKATEEIRATSSSSLIPKIHCTFLDPYDGVILEYIAEWGYGANWADSYFSRDLETREDTQQPLLYAYNVDVTTLDPNANQEQIANYVSGGDVNSPCHKTESSHGWPIDFYTNTIPPNSLSDYQGFGFLLSEEAGNSLNSLASQYSPGNGFLGSGLVKILGPEDPSCVPYVFSPAVLGSGVDFLSLPTVESTTGTIEKFLNSLQLITGSPVWIATVITDTNALNSLSFDVEFTSNEGSDGLLSIYWDTNVIGTVDEAAMQRGLQHYALLFPGATANSSHVLGFHMDSFTDVHSSIKITNVSLGYVGVQSPLLSITTNVSNGLPVYQLTGQPDNYTIQANSNLTSTNWVNIALLANTSGMVNFIDSSSTNYSMRFYRAVAQ